MKARLLKDATGKVLLLCANGTISEAPITVLANFLLNAKDAKHFSGSDGNWSASYGDMAVYPGDTLAYVADNLDLIISDFTAFEPLINETYRINHYISLGEYAEKVDKSREIIKVLCRSGRIPGAQKMAGRWMIPKDAPYPVPPERQREGWRSKK